MSGNSGGNRFRGGIDAEILPIQIRPDLWISIYGIPHDLSEKEARKISAVITALATSPSSHASIERNNNGQS